MRYRRIANAPELFLPINAASSRPLYQQLYDGLRNAILTGRLPPGASLPVCVHQSDLHEMLEVR